jgi:hypothetical protein
MNMSFWMVNSLNKPALNKGEEPSPCTQNCRLWKNPGTRIGLIGRGVDLIRGEDIEG